MTTTNHLSTASGIAARLAEIVAEFDAALARENFARALGVVATTLDAHIIRLAIRAEFGPRRQRPAAARSLQIAEQARVEMLDRWSVEHGKAMSWRGLSASDRRSAA